MDNVPRVCDDLSSPDVANFALSLFILIGILVSYLPQHVRIISRRSSFGLSPYFVLLGTTSGTFQLANILVLPRSRADVACCKQISGFACFAGLLGIAQVAVQWSCFTVILLLFLIFSPRTSPSTTHPGKDSLVGQGPTIRTAMVVTAICFIHGVITALLSAYFIIIYPDHLQSWANFLGIFSTILASIQYLPQIYTTFVLKKVASLSIPMMCIQTPGSFVWAASLAARLGPEGWSAWGVYVVTGCLQGTLLTMGIYYEMVERKRKRLEEEGEGNTSHAPRALDSNDNPSEQTPLLSSGD